MKIPGIIKIIIQRKQNKRKKFLFFAVFGLLLIIFGAGYIGAMNGWFGGVPERTAILLLLAIGIGSMLTVATSKRKNFSFVTAPKNPSRIAKLAIIAALILTLGVGGTFALNGFFGGGAAIPEDTFARGLVGYWPMDEATSTIAYDASGNGNNGVFAGYPKWTNGKNGNALQFDGKDDYLDAGTNNLNINTAMTLEAWVKFPNVGANSYYGLISKTERTNGWQLIKNYGTSTLLFEIFEGGTNSGSLNASPAISSNQWTHVVLTIDGTSWRWFINGISSGSFTASRNLTTSAANLYIGKSRASNPFLMGFIDEPRIYNRALSAAEIKFHYNHGGPAAYWKFDEGGGTLAKDSSGNINDGTINGAAWVDGKYGNALSFDGTNDYIDAGDRSSIQLIDNFTVSLWSKANSPFAGSFMMGTKNTNYTQADGWLAYHSEFAGGTVDFIGKWSGGQRYSRYSVPLDTSWHHYVFSFNNGTVNFYYDGKLQTPLAAYNAGSLSVGSDHLWIGRRDQAVGSYSAAVIDDVRIYNYARTADEIRLDYQAGMAVHFGPNGKTCSEDPASCVNKGLAGYWDMEEGSGVTTQDKSISGNAATLTNGTKWGTGKIGSALSFDSKDDYAISSTSNNLAITGDLTISAWIKPNSVSWYRWIASKNYLYEYTLGMSNSELRFYHGDGANYYAANSSGAGLTAGRWSYVSVTRDITQQKVKFYVDGKYISEWNYTNTIATSGNNLKIGTRHDNYSWFNGLIDELRIYSRALSVEEIQYQFNHGGPVGYWKFDEGSGTNLRDTSGNNFDATTTSDTVWANGKYGSALSFNGATSYVSAPAVTSRTSIVNNGITFSAWIKTASSAWQTIVANDSNSGCTYACMGGLEINSSGKVRMIVYNGSIYVSADSKKTVIDNNWHFVAGQYINGQLRIYVDGVLEGEASPGSLYGASVRYTDIGMMKELTRNDFKFSGLIDEVKIYNYARSAEDIRKDFQAGTATHLGPSGKICSEDPAGCVKKGLVGYWDIEEGEGATLLDKSGNGNTGTLVNGPKWSTGVPMADSKSALLFDGKDDYADVGNDSSLNNIQQGFSYVGWVKFNQIFRTTNGYDWQALFNKRTFGNWFGLMLQTEGAKILRFYHDGLTPVISDYTWEDIVPNTWYQVAVTYDGTATRHYINGNKKKETAVAGIPITNSNNLYLGRSDSGPYPFDGQMDEVRIYDRALSDEEIRYNYNQGKPVAWWKLDEGKGTTAFDATLNNNDGTITGATWVGGKYGSALSFDGSDDYVNAGNNASLNVAGSLTIEGWVKPSAITSPSGTWMGILGKKDGHTLPGYGLVMASYAPCRRWCFAADGLSICPAQACEQIDHWDHLAGVYDGSKLMLYQNGNLMGTTSKTGALGISSDVFKIGNLGNSYIKFNGLIDEVRIYNYARSAEQIRQDYNAGMASYLK